MISAPYPLPLLSNEPRKPVKIDQTKSLQKAQKGKTDQEKGETDQEKGETDHEKVPARTINM
jgi:hypothetical protein